MKIKELIDKYDQEIEKLNETAVERSRLSPNV
jgi:hypothetical protein